ncbi:LPXTG cell wall anchor domain-containing protein [Peterkaempfera griseoplana]|uniref:LPXTG cell wall anchor domain-containing protein n=1 Tax=Peterkaempfera griseoplana TaxID=66896 RepID=UPI00099E6B46|nr:LPXTG cell wall anchor domain-containing protein [Peterkaempfera griseoplana]
MTSVLLRRLGRLGIAGATAAAAVAMTAGPAHAADQLWLYAPYQLTVPVADAQGNALSRTLDFGLSHDLAANTVTSGSITVDISGLSGVATVVWPKQCKATGATAVCAVGVALVGAGGTRLDLGLKAAPGAKTGDHGTVRFTGQAGGMTAYPATTQITVGSGPDLVAAQLPAVRNATPGMVLNQQPSFSNRGNEAADGVTLTLYTSRGVPFLDSYDNCSYSDERDATIAVAVCRIDGSFAPGADYTLDAPVRLKVAPFALYEGFEFAVQPGTAALQADKGLKPGHGRTLRLVKRGAAPRAGADLDQSDNDASTDFTVRNTADFEAVGARVHGAAGTTVEADLAVVNHGPAWVASLRAGESIATLQVRVPEGTTVVGVPDRCSARTADGGTFEGTSGAPLYRCSTAMVVNQGERVPLPFKLRIDKVVPGATGAVSFLTSGPDGGPMPYDPHTANNRSVITVNAPAAAGSTGGGTAGGSTGGSTGSTGSTGTAAGGNDPAPQSTGGTSAGTSTAGDGSASDGSLAATGSSGTGLLAGAGAVAVVAGAGVVLAVRRRRA